MAAGLGANSNYAYAAGEGYSDVRLRYRPAVVNGIYHSDPEWHDPTIQYPYGYYTFDIWADYTTEENDPIWYLTGYPYNHLYRVNLFQPQSNPYWSQINLPAGSYGAYATDYYYEIHLMGSETSPGLVQDVGTTIVDYETELPNLSRIYNPPIAPSGLTAANVDDDSGHCITLSFNGESSGSYFIGRATNPNGPFVWISTGFPQPVPGTPWLDKHVQDNIIYYYRVIRIQAGPNPSAFSNMAAAVSTNEDDPEQPCNGVGSYNMATETVYLTWDPPNLGTNPDVAGYWVCPIYPEPSRSCIIHASPIDRTTFRAPLPYAQYPGQHLQYFVAAMDYSGNIGPWSNAIDVYVGNSIGSSTSAEATAFNNGCKFIRITDTDELWITYQSDDHIFAAYSTNEGATWNTRQIGRGFYPAISCNSIAETPRPSVVWQFEDAGIHYIYFSRYLGNDTWTDAQVIQTGAANTTFGPPSFAIGICDTGHVVYAATSGGTSTVKYTKFYLFNPIPSVTQDVGTGTNPSIAYMNSLGKPPIHVAWEYQGTIKSIKYRTRTSSGWGLTETPSGTQPAKQPVLETVGNNAYVAWAEDATSGDIYWRYKVYTGPFGTWMGVKRVNNTPTVASTYPVLTSGYACAWVEQSTSSDYEVYYSHYDVQLGVWLTPINISNEPDQEIFSNYPHITHKQTLGSTRIYFVWTEDIDSPHPIKYKTYDQGGGKESSDITLTYYVAYGGEAEPSPFNRKRDGYAQYGEEPYKRIDRANVNTFLEYRFETLNPDRIYDLTAYLYQRGSANLTLNAKIDNILLGTITLPPDTLVTLNHLIPAALYADNTINLKIIGNNNQAVSAILALHEFEPEDVKGHKQAYGNGPQSIESTPFSNYQLTLVVQPTHTTNTITIRYALPQKGQVKISLYDVSGRLVKDLVDKVQNPGIHDYYGDINKLGLSRGVYFVRLETDDKTLVQKAIVVK